MARHLPLPSFVSTKRSRLASVATASTLALATAISLAVTLPAGSSSASASDDAAYMTTVGQQATSRSPQTSTDGVGQAVLFERMRSIQGERQHEQAAVKAAAVKAAAAKAAAAKAAAVKAAAVKAAAVKAVERKAAATQSTKQAAVSTPSGTPQQIAQQMLSQYGWSSGQFSCLQSLWERESGWSVTAENPTSGAYGIPQSLPGSQMASAGSDWQTDAATQIRWGLTYIQGRYGSPCGAWAHSQADGWY